MTGCGVGRIPGLCLALSCLALIALSSCAPEVPDHSLRIQVFAAEPVADARVLLWWLDHDGHPLQRDGRRSKDGQLSPSNALAEGQTDARGVVELRTGPAYGLIALSATGGAARDPWVLPADGGEPDASPGAGDVTVPNHVELRSVLVDFLPSPASRDVAITPLTTLAVTLGERRLAHSSKEDTYSAAMARAFDLLGTHFWGLDLTRPPGAGQSPSGLDTEVEHTLALQALAALAHRIAETSHVSGRSFHTLTLLEALVRDAADDRALLDGIAPEGPIVVAACPSPTAPVPGELAASDGCAPGEDPAGAPACRSICDLDSHTLRARLASALAFDFVPSAHNQTDLSLVDVRVLVEDLRTNIEPELFGDADGVDLDGPLPTIDLASSPVHDERQDAITFDENAVPTHTPGPDSLVDLADQTACPTVGKHIHRLADPGDNALRWHVVLHDRTGWSSNGDAPAPLEYRIKHRSPASADAPPADAPLAAGCSTEPEQAWLTDWRSAEAVGSTDDDGILYEVALVREHVPELAEVTEGELEIVFRGQDVLGQEVVTCRCWNHVLLPAPLEVGPVTEANGVGSLQARSLFPGNNLAPLLDGVPLDQAVVLGSFEIRNGTDEPTYVRLSVEQPLVRFTKCWQRSNAEILFITSPDPNCVPERTCLSTFPPDRQSMVVVDTGVIERLVTGLRVQDTSTPAPTPSCAPGDADAHCIGPRLSPTAARTYRVDLLVSDLSALAPRTSSEPPAFYFDAAIAPPYAIPITGAISEGIFHVCTFLFEMICRTSGMYQYYRALVAAELGMDDSLSVRVAMLPVPHLLLSPSLDVITKLESFAWSTHEQSLPKFHPSLLSTPPLCPIVERALR